MVKWLTILAGLLASAAIAGVIGYRLHRNNPSALLERANAALERGDRHEADRLAGLLEQRGNADHARLIRGKSLVIEGRSHLERAGRLSQQNQIELSLAMLLDGAALAGQPAVLRRDTYLYNPRAAGPLMTLRPVVRQRIEAAARARTAFSQALGELSRIDEESSLSPDSAALAGECLVHVGDLRRAAEALKYVVERRPDHKDAHWWLAYIWYELGAMHDAIKHSEEVGRLNPKDGYAYWRIGHIYKDYSQSGLAIKNYRKALERELRPAIQAEAIRELGELLVTHEGEAGCKEVVALLERCPESFARRPEYLALRAEALMGLQQSAEAVKLLDAALGADPDLSRALLLRARLELYEDKPKEAIPYLERALRLDPHDEKSRDQLAHAYERLGDSPRAAEQRRLRDETQEYKNRLTALNADAMNKPLDDKLRYLIAEVWWKMGRPAETRMWLEAALACNPNNKEAKDMLRRLQEGTQDPMSNKQAAPHPEDKGRLIK